MPIIQRRRGASPCPAPAAGQEATRRKKGRTQRMRPKIKLASPYFKTPLSNAFIKIVATRSRAISS